MGNSSAESSLAGERHKSSGRWNTKKGFSLVRAVGHHAINSGLISSVHFIHRKPINSVSDGCAYQLLGFVFYIRFLLTVR